MQNEMYILLIILLYSCWCAQTAGRTCLGDYYPCPEDVDICLEKWTLCDGTRHCPYGSDETNCRPENCAAEEYYCVAGFCQPKNTLCNGHNDCPDGSDEENCRPENCTGEKFYCTKGFCIRNYKVCNGYNDCGDWFDEENCAPANCQHNHFPCRNFQHICKHKRYRCDGQGHCPYSSDENCGPENCSADQFFCPEGICRPLTEKCDGKKDCMTGSDEEDCRPESCTADQFFCPEGSCRPLTEKCDGENDCKDGSDENCGPENCTAEQIYCAKGFCKPKQKRCDKRNDCKDWSDEKDCPPANCWRGWFPCPHYQRICKPESDRCSGYGDCPYSSDENCGPENCTADQFFCPEGICRPQTKFCDGKKNCKDGFDEANCRPENCRDDYFFCPEGSCRPLTEKCDGKKDCKDGSDENCRPENCTTDQFLCPEGSCRPLTKKCDGEKDCKDGSDENCRPENCTTEQFYCPKGFCIPLYEKCDDTNDCKDWYDEENCPQRTCYDLTCKNGRCTDKRFKCNMFNDCGDWTDELQCLYADCSGKNSTMCPGFKCVGSRHTCNGFNDCGNWADEDRCDGGTVGCDPGWHYHRGRCFRTRSSNKDITWREAQHQCLVTNSTLPSVTGRSDEKFLMGILPNNVSTVYIGLQKDYKNAIGTFQSKLRWDDYSSITYTNWRNRGPGGGKLEQCTVMIGIDGWKDIFCAEYATRALVCMKYVFSDPDEWLQPPRITIKGPRVHHNWLKSCNSGELMSKYKFCDGYRDCRDGSDEEKCDASCKSNQYQCEDKDCISVSFYCDGIKDCGDNSDEKNCEMKLCSDDEWTCANGQCIEESKRCDFRTDCYDETDEADCGETCRGFTCYEGQCIPQSWVNDGEVDCDGYEREDETGDVSAKTAICLYGADEYGKVSFRLYPEVKECVHFGCPDMYYKCPLSYCIPVMFVCDGKRDCPSGEDEIYCNRYVCFGYYRCQGPSFCIHPRQLCDGLRHCPMGDDERYCPLPCPASCECDGRVSKCDQSFTLQTTIPSDVRKLNVSGVNIQNGSLDLSYLHYLAILDVSQCQLTTIKGLFVKNINLIYLNLSNNALQRVSEDSFSSLIRLRHLDLSNNMLLTVETGTFLQLSSLQYLNLSNTSFGDLNEKSFNGLSGLVRLNISNGSIEKIDGKPFISMKLLRHLDLRHNNIEQFSCCFLKHLESLQRLFAHSYQFCCDSMLPKSLTSENCIATLSDEISSCKDLLGQRVLKVILWIIVLFALFGNIAVLIYRIKYDRQSLKRSYGIFVTNLSISDCLMGVYMLIIGIADAEYRDKYVSEDYGWRHGLICKFSGFLSTMSSEASCIFISLITIDRFLAIKYPFGDLKFTRRTTVVATIITWMSAAVLAAVPLLPSLSHWKLYSQNSVCLALPLSSEKTSGWQYSTAIFIGLNFILFLFIGVGQILIFREIKAMPKMRGGGSNDVKIALRLFFVVITDFFCWVPVGVMGILALCGISIDKEVFSWTAVTVLPVNSALNPVLYTLPSMLRNWRKSNRENTLTRTAETLLKDTPLPNHPAVKNTRRFVGKRTEDMETLGDVIRAREISNDVKGQLIGFVVIFICDLKQQERNFEAVTDENIFVSICGEEVTAVCLSMKPEEDRHWQVEDVRFLTKLLLENIRKRTRRTTRHKLHVEVPSPAASKPNQCQRRGTMPMK